MKAWLVALALATLAAAPIRPLPVDTSVKNGGTGAYTWYQGHTANQTERDAMELARIGQAFPEAVLLARSVAGCQGAASTSVTGMSRIFTAFFPIYAYNTLVKSHGTWFLGDYGHYYDDEHLALERVRACLLSTSATCAKALGLTSSLQIVLDLHVDNGRCVAGNPAHRPAPTEPYDDATAHEQVMTSSTAMPLLDANQTRLLLATHDAHLAVSDWRCGVSGTCTSDADCRGSYYGCVMHVCTPKSGTVVAQHAAFEASARAGQEHCFQAPAFSGLVDPGLTVGQVCTLARKQDEAHHAWMTALAQGNCGAAYVAGLVHTTTHVCMNLGSDDRLQVRLPCGKPIANCPVTTCRNAP